MNIKEGCNGCFVSLANTAYRLLYLADSSVKKEKQDIYYDAQNFWKLNRKRIESINKKFYMKVHFPHFFSVLLWIKKHWKS